MVLRTNVRKTTNTDERPYKQKYGRTSVKLPVRTDVRIFVFTNVRPYWWFYGRPSVLVVLRTSVRIILLILRTFVRIFGFMDVRPYFWFFDVVSEGPFQKAHHALHISCFHQWQLAKPTLRLSMPEPVLRITIGKTIDHPGFLTVLRMAIRKTTTPVEDPHV